MRELILPMSLLMVLTYIFICIFYRLGKKEGERIGDRRGFARCEDVLGAYISVIQQQNAELLSGSHDRCPPPLPQDHDASVNHFKADFERFLEDERLRQLFYSDYPRWLPPKEEHVSLPEDTSE